MPNRYFLLLSFACFSLAPALHADPGTSDFQANLKTVEAMIEARKQGLAALERRRSPPAAQAPAATPRSGASPSAVNVSPPAPAPGRDPFAQTALMLGSSASAGDGGGILPNLRLKAITMKPGAAFALLEIENDNTLLLRAGDVATVRTGSGASATLRLKRIRPDSVELETGTQKNLILR